MAYRYLFSVDPSLTCSGWALFSVMEGKLRAVGKIASKTASHGLSLRLQDLQLKIKSVYESLDLSSEDVLICESPTTMRDPNAAIKVEQVRSIFETLARSFGLYVPGRINPRSVQNEILGIKGRQIKRELVKAMAVEAVHNLYRESLDNLGFSPDKINLKKNQDIVDAILIGNLALSRIATAKLGSLSLGEIFSSSYPARNGRLLAR